MREHGAQHAQRAKKVGLEEIARGFDRHLFDTAEDADAGVAHEAIETGYARQHQRDRLGDRFLLAGVERDEAHAG